MPDNSVLTLLAITPIGLSGLGWVAYKVIAHEAFLVSMRESLVRLETKVDRLIERA